MTAESPTPKRIQLSRQKGWRKPEGAVVVARPSKWGNPFVIRQRFSGAPQPYEVVTVSDGPDGETAEHWRYAHSAAGAAAAAVELFELHIGPMGSYEYDADRMAALRALAGKDLACWCPLDQPCHADVLLELANGAAS